jgi:hypothetical protein
MRSLRRVGGFGTVSNIVEKAQQVLNEPQPQTQDTQAQPSAEPGTIERVPCSLNPTITREIVRGIGGKFVANRKRLEVDVKSSDRVEKELREVINRPATDSEGNPILDPKTKKPLSMQAAAAAKLLQMVINLKEERALSGASHALATILERSVGKVKSNPSERSDSKSNEIRVIVIPAPEGLATMEKVPELKKQPSWLKAELVSENPKKNLDIPDSEN